MTKKGIQSGFIDSRAEGTASRVINASQPRRCRKARRMRGVDNPSIEQGELAEGKKENGVPNGLARIVNNWLLSNPDMEDFKNGLIQEADIIFKFERMFKNVQGVME